MARFQIARSEGARAGHALTSWGVGLSVVPAVLFLTYMTVKDFAVSHEATTFTDNWFDRLRQSESQPLHRLTTFWDTLPVQRLWTTEFEEIWCTCRWVMPC